MFYKRIGRKFSNSSFTGVGYTPNIHYCGFNYSSRLRLLNIPKPQTSLLTNCHPSFNLLDLIKCSITNDLHQFTKLNSDSIFNCISWSSSPDQGDLILPLPRLESLKKSLNLEHDMIAKLIGNNPFISNIVMKNKIIKIYMKSEVLSEILLPMILNMKENYGKYPMVVNKTALIEFSSPNIAKPFHAGHLRSTILGGFLTRLHKLFGWNVISMNYLGDWGKQFGLLAVGYLRYGDENKLEEDPIKHLFDVYVKINRDLEAESDKGIINDQARQFFWRLENNDTDALELWSKFRGLSIQRYTEVYKKLGISYDVYSGESEITSELISDVFDTLKKKQLVVRSQQGTYNIDLTETPKGDLGRPVVRKSDGTSLYLTRDIGAAISRYQKYKFDKMIYVVASQQDMYMKQLFAAIEKMGYQWSKNLEHVNFGLVKGMSTRKGNAVFLDDILYEAKSNISCLMRKKSNKDDEIDQPEHVAEQIGNAAVLIQDMQAKRINNYKFDWKRILSFEGDTGPYLQYAHARLCSLDDKFGKILDISTDKLRFDLLNEKHALDLIRILNMYPNTLLKAHQTREPSTLITYLFRLTHQVSICYEKLRVAGQPEHHARARVALYRSARQVLCNGLELLGITPVNRM